MQFKNIFRKKVNANKPKKSALREWGDALLFALIASTIVRGIIFSAYAIPSGSMEGSLLIGDHLFVDKLAYGARMPITPVTVPFTEPTVYGVKTYWDGIELPYYRLPGYTEPKKGDCVVFNKPEELETPIDQRTTLIKRCQATPGDELRIINSQVYINGKPAANAPRSLMEYVVQTDGKDINQLLLTDLSIQTVQQLSLDQYVMLVPLDKLKEFKSYSNIKSVEPVLVPATQYDSTIFPHSDHFKWNLDNFGPLVMPKKGMTVALNDSTLTLYRMAIESHEGNKVETNGKDILINGSKADTYTFKMNYYWMMGDNRHNSLDSRFWGYVPEDHIIGKAAVTWLSTDSSANNMLNKVRWNRFFRLIK
ncbi:signal peptidase I [Mucilaginibacter myungsuensis]|uniref:Signal peptidase I n=1 Tax=Mucilaginibacter myungsuensis TaxID=649104 RepID=A0A929KVG4_9SPHI|nr:signal peptidase I [Mucilaginibacter myungsuensis]MBE9662336.1 signal peptidase I [Mucilaginibacter myungsuensis]MDN3599227.1 signal peptidase I [Mucilaginibacter myungsuensis]